MKKINILLTAIVAVFILIGCSHPSEGTKETIQNNQVQVDTSKKEAEVEPAYVCPMGKDCGSSDQPGECSGCGMKMKPSKKK